MIDSPPVPVRPSDGPAAGDPIRVMLVDDSAVIRGLFTRTLESDPALSVVASAGDGEMAINTLKRHDIDVLVLDIEMPRLDGLSALPKLLEVDPGLPIIMASTLTARNAEISLKALAAGAKEYVTKPSSTRDLTSADAFKRELIAKIKVLGAGRRDRRKGAGRASPTPRAVSPTPPARPASRPIVLRRPGTARPQAIAIGSSTGGPQALFAVLAAVDRGLPQPIFLTQHMPPTFTAILAQHIQRVTGWACAEAVDGEPVRGGRIYLAPGDFHMTIETSGADRVIRLDQGPPENFCRPSVDPMLRSLVAGYGGNLLVVVLTGMGQDGLKGAAGVVAAGGTVIAQDEATSVVWGMPGAVAQAGLCSAVMPLDRIGAEIQRIAQGRAS